MIEALRAFGREFPTVLAAAAPRFCLAWLASLVILILAAQWLRRNIRPHILRLDTRVRHFAAGLRYKNRDEREGEMHARTWFFRFWTNFASAPALSCFSILLPIWAHATHHSPPIFICPAFATLVRCCFPLFPSASLSACARNATKAPSATNSKTVRFHRAIR